MPRNVRFLAASCCLIAACSGNETNNSSDTGSVFDAGHADAQSHPDASANTDAGVNKDAALAPLPESEMTLGSVGQPNLQIPALAWNVCPLYRANDPAGDPSRMAECADMEVPAYWDNSSEKFKVHIKRLLGTGTADTQLWFVSGGPGAAATTLYAGYLQFFQDYIPNIDVYTIDQRGTGKSERLACPEQEAPESTFGNYIDESELPGCVAYLHQTQGTRLKAYATTYSAIDMAAAIEATRAPGQKVFIWGASYGTIVAQRYLQVFPNQADGTILVAINPPDATMIDIHRGYDYAGSRLLSKVCAEDSFCAGKFTGSPLDTYVSAMKRIKDAGHCKALTDRVPLLQIRQAFGHSMGTETYLSLVPAMTHRLARCNSQDAEVLFSFISSALGQSALIYEDPQLWADALKYHVEYSEMYYNDMYPDQTTVDKYFQGNADQPFFDSDPTIDRFHKIWAPIAYKDPAYGNKWATTDQPMMMFQGGLDPQTPRDQADRVGQRFMGSNQHYIVFEQATHAFEKATRYYRPPLGERDCYVDLWLTFMANPKMTPDLSCVANTQPIDFNPQDEVIAQILGTMDVWGDVQ